ncbi:hypothetical protein VIGAN_06024100 [Vigna angularis var. angularis]|uniref:Uncharacterized protein n=1 Tax=Vigna angularis var. angularis TaxID=157739 RepID=A0A0S3S903_PHAAN|nr:hypothetical protein VIGAN_06024100 [Vigna angularis var. angularis]
MHIKFDRPRQSYHSPTPHKILNQRIQNHNNIANTKIDSSESSKNNCLNKTEQDDQCSPQLHASDSTRKISFSKTQAVIGLGKKGKEERINNGGKPVWGEIPIIIFSRLIVRMILSKLFGVTLIPIKPLPVFSKFIIQFHVPFTPRIMLLSIQRKQVRQQS